MGQLKKIGRIINLAKGIIYSTVVTLTQNLWFHSIYWMVDSVILVAIFSTISLLRKGKKVQQLLTVLMASVVLLIIPKLFYSLLLLAEDITRLFRGFPPKSLYVSKATLALTGLFFCIILFGLTHGKYFYRVRRETLYFSNLPDAFNGLTITQISDIHSGSLSISTVMSRESNSKGLQKSKVAHSVYLWFLGVQPSH